MKLNLNRIALHFLGGGFMAIISGGHGAGLVVAITWAWVMREAVQRDPHDILAALRTMPSWSLQAHLQWIAPGLAAALVAVIHAALA